MIYDYHCVDCGRKMSGDEISFDLAELIGIRTKENEMVIPKKLTLITADNLLATAEKCGAKLKQGTRSKLEISLKDFLKILADNIEIDVDKKTITDCPYDQEDMLSAFTKIWPNEVSAAAVNDQIETLISAIWSVFYSKPGVDQESRKTEDYIASCYIAPEFFQENETNKLYSLSFAINDTVHMNKLNHPGLIRGYCPKCGAYVYDGAGKYEHVLVGLLGVQSAGKTSVIVAMLQELLDSYMLYGINYPGNVLCDTKWKITQDMLTLYANGYPPTKTDAVTSVKTFNASFLLESEKGGKRKIVTFVDIAGEQCYDTDKKAFNPDALQTYPLITGCSIYLLCTCISQKGYVKEDGKAVNLPYNAVMEVAKGIYAYMDNEKQAPPLCILVTKSDMAEVKQDICNRNPFDQVKLPENYYHRDAFNMLSAAYESAGDDSIRKPLDWCCSVYYEMKKTTYISMMSCSAMGRAGGKCKYYPDDMGNIQPAKDENGEVLPVQRDNMDVLWNWILQVSGMVETKEAGVTLSHIPAFTDSYDCENGFISDSYRQVFSVDEFEERFAAVQTLFLNVSPHDEDLEAATMEELSIVERIRGVTTRRKMIDVVKGWG